MSIAISRPDAGGPMQQALATLGQVVAGGAEPDKLLGETVRLSGAALQAGGAGVWGTEAPDKPELLLEHNLAGLGLLQGQVPLPGMTVAVRRAVREGKSLIVPPYFVDNEANDLPVNPSPFELLFVPLRLQGKVAMVLVMAVPAVAEDVGVHRAQVAFLQRMLGTVEGALAQQHLKLLEKDRGTSSKVVLFAEQVHQHLLLREVAVDIANLVRDVIEADRVTVELYPRLRRKVVAVSNVDEPSRRAALMQAQRLVLEYARERNVPVMLDREAATQLVSDPVLQDAVAAYFMASNFTAFMAAPIRQQTPGGEKVTGVILAEYTSSPKAQQHSNLATDLARVCASSVSNALVYEAVPLRRTLHAVGELWRKPTSTKRYAILTVLAVAGLAAGFLGLVPLDFSVKTDCAVQPVGQLAMVAPMDGRIIDVPVRAGEHVYAKADEKRAAARGETVKPLMVFDTTDLLAARAEQQQKEAELLVALKDVGDKGDLSKVGTVQLQLRQVLDQIKLLSHQIEMATVYSPIEGTVLTENVEQKKWSSVRLGEPLLEVASFADWVLVVDVPETEAATVRDALARSAQRAAATGEKDAGIAVDYIFYPWPDQRYGIRAKGIATLLPASSQAKNANVFRLQIPVNRADLPPGIALSGVTGRAKVHVGRLPLAVQWTRGVRRLVRMTVMF